MFVYLYSLFLLPNSEKGICPIRKELAALARKILSF